MSRYGPLLRSVDGVDTPDPSPDALLDAEEPVRRRVSVGATLLYVEEQGSGPAVLLIGAADEDAEFYRGGPCSGPSSPGQPLRPDRRPVRPEPDEIRRYADRVDLRVC
jgi:hypothetical protein